MRILCELDANKNKLAILLVVGLMLPSFSFAQQPISPPETLEEAKEIGLKGLKEIQLNLWDYLKQIWKKEALPIWQKMYYWFKKNIWDSFVFPKIKYFFQKLKIEIKERKPMIEEEFKKEKKEMKEEIKTELPKTGQNLWQKFKELIK